MGSPRRTTTGRSTGGRPSATRSGSPYCPEAGEFVWVDLDPTRGHEQQGRRPALVLSARIYNERTGLCIACAITTKAKRFRFEVPISAAAAVTGVVLADQLRCLSWLERRAQFIGSAPVEVVDDVREKVAALIGIH